MSIPPDALDQVALLLSGASSVRDQDARAVYLASARSLLARHAEKARQLESALAEMERDLVRCQAPKEQQRLKVGTP